MGSRSTPPPLLTTSELEPPAFTKEGLTFASERALELAQGPAPEFFPGSTVTPFAPETEEALGLITDRARAGSPLIRGAQTTALQTIQGRGVNPFLGEAVTAATAPLFDKFSQETLPALRSSFAGIGRSGSGAEQGALNRAITAFGRGTAEQASLLAFGSAEAEAGRQQTALGLAPTLAAQDFTDAQRLSEVGGVREQQAGLELQDEIERFNFAQGIDQARLNDLISQLTGLTGNFGKTTLLAGQAKRPNRFTTGLQGAAGGAITGLIASGGNPFGALVGGAIGGIGGIA